jgi:hypothetical protein
MKAGLQVLLVVVLTAGCAQQSRFHNDPRAAVLGPDYLDYIDKHPRDRDTQYCYPAFTVRGLTNWVDPLVGMQSVASPDVQRLETIIPPMLPEVQAIEGKGWPELERKGLPVFLPKQQ